MRATVGRVSADVDGDGHVTALDVNALTADWVVAAEHDGVCTCPSVESDIDGDGCTTIADLQTVAAAVNPAPGADQRAAGVHSAAIKTFTVTSTGDGPDSVADGVCFNAATSVVHAARRDPGGGPHRGPRRHRVRDPGRGLHTIAPGSQLPSLNNPNGITIDGFTQPGSQPNTDPLVDNAIYRIELKGKGANGINGIVVVNATTSFGA